MIKVILFDADGVLINGEMFTHVFASEFGVSTDLMLPFFEGPFRDCIVGNADLKEVVAPHLAEWGWNKGVDAFLKYWFKAEHRIDQELVDYIQTIRKQGIRCFIATNQEKHRSQYMLDNMGFAESFDDLFASAHFGHRKPSMEFYEKVMNGLGAVKKEEVLFWDDTPKNVEAAREFGIHAEIYTSFTDFKEKMAGYQF